MHSSILLLVTLSAHSLAIAIAKPYDPSTSWNELPVLEAYNYNLPPGNYLAQTPSIITPIPKPIALPVASPISTCEFPRRLACCATNDYNGCYDASYASFCSGKPLVCCSRVDIISQIGSECGPLTPARPAAQSPQQSGNPKVKTQERITGEEKQTTPNQVTVPNAPGAAGPEGSQEEFNPIWWSQEE